MRKELILDRGFLDGAFITELKREQGIDVLIPLKSNMQAREDALRLITELDLPWTEYQTVRDAEGNVVKTEEVAGVGEIRLWDTCHVPWYVAVMRVSEADGSVTHWALASTRPDDDPAQAFRDDANRTDIEERHRQLKGGWNLTKFTSTDFNLIAMHVYFILLVYTLVQLDLKKGTLTELANRTIETRRQEERLGLNAVIVYAGRHFATFDLDEYSDILLHLRPLPLERMRKWIRLFRQQKTRPPPDR